MASPKSLNNTLFMNSAQKNTTSARTVLEKLKTLSSRSSSAAANSLERLSGSNSLGSSVSNSPESNWNLVKKVFQYFFIFLIVAFIVLNILVSFNLLPDFLADLFSPILIFFGYNIGETVRQTAEVSDAGVKSLSSAIPTTVDNSVDILEEKTQLNKSSTTQSVNNNRQNNTSNQDPNQDPEPIQTSDQTNRPSSRKSGYCYIGEDRGFRSCIKVGNNDKCMSGDIFPTEEICINPSLRA